MNEERIIGYFVAALLLAGPVLIARKRSVKCNWDAARTARNKWWSIIGLIAVVGGSVLGYATTPEFLGIGIVGAVIFWICYYRLVLALYRENHIRREAAINASAETAARKLAEAVVIERMNARATAAVISGSLQRHSPAGLFCTRCGRPMPSDALFCSQCGSPTK